jgi:putative DNA primase/helicase
MGYTLLGRNPEQILVLMFGHGANGKSVLINTILDILGSDYAQQMSPDTIMESKKGFSGPRTDLASLQGVRFVSTSETGEGNRLNEPLLKQLTGGDRIRARFLYHDEFEFTPQFTVLLSTNHKPYVGDNGHAIWRRIRVVPFNVTIPNAA